MTEEEILIFNIQRIIEDNYEDENKTAELVQNALDASEFTTGSYLRLITNAACKIALGKSVAINEMSLDY